MKILVISNMYPSVKDPVYGTFVQTFVEQMKVLNTEGKTNIIVIKGRDGEYGRKLFKYVKFYISILFLYCFGNMILSMYIQLPILLSLSV